MYAANFYSFHMKRLVSLSAQSALTQKNNYEILKIKYKLTLKGSKFLSLLHNRWKNLRNDLKKRKTFHVSRP